MYEVFHSLTHQQPQRDPGIFFKVICPRSLWPSKPQRSQSSVGPEITLPRRTSKMFALFHLQCSWSLKQGIRFLRHQVENVGNLDKPSGDSGNWVTGERVQQLPLCKFWVTSILPVELRSCLSSPSSEILSCSPPKWDSTVKVLVLGHTSVLSTALITARSFVPHLSSQL